MSSPQRRLARLRRHASDRFLVTCEHASNAIPSQYDKLGVPGGVLRSHVAWDPGAREVASILSHRLGCQQYVGRYSRLLIDLNRSRRNPTLIPRELFGVKIPGNRRLTRKEREARIAKYYQPYREFVERAARQCIERAGSCIHLSVHTFAPELDGEVRNADVGLLYDPARKLERTFAARLGEHLERHDFTVRMNYPYRGTADGLTAHLRRKLPKMRYLGIELEINQKVVSTNREIWRVGRILAEGVAAIVEI